MLQLLRKTKNDMLYSKVYKEPKGQKDKVTPDIDGFTNEPVVQRGVRVIKDIYVDGSK